MTDTHCHGLPHVLPQNHMQTDLFRIKLALLENFNNVTFKVQLTAQYANLIECEMKTSIDINTGVGLYLWEFSFYGKDKLTGWCKRVIEHIRA